MAKTVRSRNPGRKHNTPVPTGKGVKVMAAKKRRNTPKAAPRRRPAARRNPTHHRRHHRRRNPGETMDLVQTAGGVVAGGILAGILGPLIPVGQGSALTQGLVKVGLGLALFMAFKQKGSFTKGVALGAAAAGVNDIVKPYIPSTFSGYGGTTQVVPINVAALPPAAAAAVGAQMNAARRMGQIRNFPTQGIAQAGMGRMGAIRRVG